MSAEAGTPLTGNVGPDVAVTITVTRHGMSAEWTPEIPDWKYLAEWVGEYRKVRDAAVLEWAKREGIPPERIAMIEV